MRSCLALAGLMVAMGAGAGGASAQGDDARYTLVHGCYNLKSASLGRVVATDAGPFRMQATDLGSYLLYTPKATYLSGGGGVPLLSADAVAPAAQPSDASVWTVDGRAGAFTLTLKSAGKALGVAGDGSLRLVDPAQAETFGFEPADGCAIYPESEVNVSGAPSTAPSPFGAVKGLLDAHMHWMAFEFLGGKAHCGKPWDRFGIAFALVDCPDHSVPGSPGNALEFALGGPPVHDTVGWPTFNYWPNPHSLTHENTYWKWMERAWRGGLRVFVNLYVDNAALCKIYPEKSHNCNEMDTVRLEITRLRQLQNYVDAQYGGPGKGWLRLVTDPFQARRVVAQGKLAVVQGIEVSKLFDCGITNDVPTCDKAQVDRQLDAVYAAGVRDMELVNKFDNAFVGVAGDAGTTGVLVNSGNKIETGKYWDMQTCRGLPADVHDRDQYTAPGPVRDGLAGAVLQAFVPGGQAPVYPAGPHCNSHGLTSLGEYLLGRMIDKRMIIDPDHMSVLARRQTLDLLESRRYSGVISSHSWSTPDAYPRIYRLGGIVTPYAGDSTGFAREWKVLKGERDPRFYWGMGYGADMNGFGSQGAPRKDAAQNPVVYPFKSFDGKQTVDREVTGKRVWDINTDGVAQYGMYPDWVEDLRKVAGDEIVNDMGRGAEAYLEMWERAVGVGRTRPMPARERFSRHGLWKVLLGASPEALLRSAGQPAVRNPYQWRWRVVPRDGRTGRVSVALAGDGTSALVLSTAPEHPARGVAAGDSTRHLHHTRAFGSGIRVRSAGGGATYVYGVRRGRVRFVAVASRTAMRSRATLRRYVRRAGLR